jgi:dCMP deaminase
VVTKDNYVRGVGYNGFPRGIADTKARLADPAIKLALIIHAEVNALAAAEDGDCIYVYPCLPCTLCLGQIIQRGIKRIVTMKSKPKTKWSPDLVLSLAEEADMEVVIIKI